MDDISHGTYVNTAAETMANSLKLTISHGSGTEEETEEETTPRPEEFITREGRSTFYYGDHIDSVSTASTEEVKSTVEELDKKDQKNGFE